VNELLRLFLLSVAYRGFAYPRTFGRLITQGKELSLILYCDTPSFNIFHKDSSKSCAAFGLERPSGPCILYISAREAGILSFSSEEKVAAANDLQRRTGKAPANHERQVSDGLLGGVYAGKTDSAIRQRISGRSRM
jgi:hypothetical protein